MTNLDVRNFEVALEHVMEATAQMIDIFAKVAEDCENKT